MTNYNPTCSFCKLVRGEVPDKVMKQLELKHSTDELKTAFKSLIVFEDEHVIVLKTHVVKKIELPLSPPEDPNWRGFIAILKDHRPSFTESEKRHIRKVLKSLGCKGRVKWKRKPGTKHASCTAKLN